MPSSVSPRRSRRGRWLSFLGLALGVACAGGGLSPRAPTSALAPDLGEGRGAESSGAFRVVFAAPQGEASEASEISVLFDRPLRALERADSPLPAIAITPSVPGAFRWAGARALVFRPERGALPAATEYTVEVPRALRALDGSELGAPYGWRFTTPRPALVRSEPWSAQTGIVPSASIELEMNQVIAPAELERRATLSARGKPLGFSVQPKSAETPKRLVVRPRKPLPEDSEIVLAIAPELVGTEGPLPAGKPAEVRFRTYGPLDIESVDCNRESPSAPCQPGSGVSLSFTNPVRFGDVKRALSIEPALPLAWPSWQEDSATTTYVEVPARFEAGKRYTLRVAKGVRDEYGHTLAADRARSIVMADLFPRVAIGLTSGTLIPADQAPIPVAAVNAPDAKVLAAVLGRRDVERLTGDAGALEALLRAHPRVRRVALPGGAAKNQFVEARVDPVSLLGTAASGVIGLATEYRADARDYGAPERSKLAKLGDLGISAKISRHGSLVWVTRLSTAASVPGAEIELVQPKQPRRRYTADSSGMAFIPASDFAPNLESDPEADQAMIFAGLGAEWTYETLGDRVPAWSLPVSVELSGELGVDGLVFTDRGVYRPGDPLRVKGAVRRRAVRGSVVPAGEKLKLVLRSPDDQVVRERELTVSRWGTFDAELTLPASGQLGSYQLTAALGRDVIRESVRVEEYKPVEFRVDVAAKPAVIRGDAVDFAISGEYLYGAPVAGASVRASVLKTPATFALPGADDFVTEAGAYYTDRDEVGFETARVADTEAKLDEKGRLAWPQRSDATPQRGPARLNLDAEVTDLARRNVAGSASVLVHPAEFYLGLERPKVSLVNAKDAIEPRVIAAAPDGLRRAGVAVRLELVERRWTVTREQRGGPYPETVSKLVDRKVAQCDVVTRTEPVACRLVPPRAGYYVIVARAVDARKNPVEAALGFYALGAGEASFRDNDQGLVDVVLDKASYRVGERARVLVKSPYPEAEALVTVERAGVLRRERRSLRGAMPSFELEVTEEFRPNAFVSVELVRKLGKGAASLAGGAMRLGYAELHIDPSEKRLSVEVLPSARDLRPGAELGVEVRVRDARGKPRNAEVALYAVDEGVLLLTGYTTPDPVRVFTAPRPLQVATLDTRSHLAKIQPGLTSILLGNKGEEGGGGGADGTRVNFQQTAYFNPSLVTEQGNARARFRLPDSLTSYRVMAVVVGEGDAFGFGTAGVTTSKRLMARPALPRFVRAGDRFEAGVVVAAKRFGPADVEVRAKVQGLALEGPASRRVRLGADGGAEVRFAFRAERAGSARFEFDVEGGGERDSVAVVRAVLAPASLEATALTGSTSAAAAEKLGALQGVRSDVGGVELTLASSALVGVESAVTALAEYPYGCTEQIASRVLPAVALSGFVEQDRAARTRLGVEVAKLLARQRPDGGFGFWPEAAESHAWVSAYALWTLDAAKRARFEVPDTALTRGREYLRRALATETSDLVDASRAAFALDVLASLGSPDEGFMNRLFEGRAKLPVFAKGLLLSAFARAGTRGDQAAILIRELEAALRVVGAEARVVENTGDAYAVLLDSPARTQAIVLRALTLARREHPLLVPLVRGLLAARRGGTWRTTQESAFALVALDVYREAAEKQRPDFAASVSFGERELVKQDFRGVRAEKTVHVAMSDVAKAPGAAFVFEKDGSGALHYQVRLRYARAELPRAPLDAGFYVEKSLSSLDPAALGTGLEPAPGAPSLQFRAGELVLGELLITNPEPAEYVVIDDPLPAGFEAVDASFQTSSSRYALSEPESGDPETERDRRAHGRGFRSSDFRRELRDDRVLFFVDSLPPGVYRYRYLARATTLGRFVVPPSRAEAMYSPEVFGRTAAAEVEVR